MEYLPDPKDQKQIKKNLNSLRGGPLGADYTGRARAMVSAALFSHVGCLPAASGAQGMGLSSRSGVSCAAKIHSF